MQHRRALLHAVLSCVRDVDVVATIHCNGPGVGKAVPDKHTRRSLRRPHHHTPVSIVSHIDMSSRIHSDAQGRGELVQVRAGALGDHRCRAAQRELGDLVCSVLAVVERVSRVHMHAKGYKATCDDVRSRFAHVVLEDGLALLRGNEDVIVFQGDSFHACGAAAP